MPFSPFHLSRVLSAWLYFHVRLSLSRLLYSCVIDYSVFIHVIYSVSSVFTYIINGNYV